MFETINGTKSTRSCRRSRACAPKPLRHGVAEIFFGLQRAAAVAPSVMKYVMGMCVRVHEQNCQSCMCYVCLCGVCGCVFAVWRRLGSGCDLLVVVKAIMIALFGSDWWRPALNCMRIYRIRIAIQPINHGVARARV